MEKIFLVTLVAGVVGLDPWNSSQQISKTASDHKALSAQQKIQTSLADQVSHMDDMLSGNQSILQIQQEQLDNLHSIYADKANSAEQGEADLKKLQSQAANLSTALEQAKKKAEDARQARDNSKEDWMDAKKSRADAMENKNKRDVELSGAQTDLRTVSISSPPDVPAAKAKVDKKQEELTSAEAALTAAQKDEAAKEADHKKADAAAEKSVEARDAASAALQKTRAAIEGQMKLLFQLKNSAADENELKENMKEAVDKQSAEVAQLQVSSSALHKKLTSKIAEVKGLQKTVDDDSSCVEELQGKESVYNHKKVSEEMIMKNYHVVSGVVQKQLYGAFWEAKDELDKAHHELYNIQKKCAPKDVTIPPVDPPAVCDADTGGTCRFFGCKSKRHAHCSDQATCLCHQGSCAQDGICQSRGDVPTSGAAMLDEIKHVGEATYGAEIWLRPAGVVAVGFAVAAAVVLLRQSVKQIDFPENLLG